MKLHLPTSLRGALIACMGVACTAYAADYTATHQNGTSANDGIGAVLDGTRVTLASVAAGDKIIFNLSSGYMVNATPVSIAADIEIQNWTLSDAFSTKSYTFTGTVTGSGNFVFTKAAPKEQSYTFTGNLSGYTGSINFNNHGDKNHVFTFTNSAADTTKTLNAAAVAVGGEIAFDGAGSYAVNSALTAYDLDVDTNVTFSRNVTAMSSFDLATGMTATFTAGALDLSGATLTNSGTIDLGNSATLQLAAANTYTAGEYTVGTLSYGNRDFNDVLVGLTSRQTASYSDGVITVTGSGLDLTWNATADGTSWTAAGAWLNGSDTETFVDYDNSVTFGADAASKKVDISGSVTVADSINIEDDYEFNVTSASTITGLFNMTEGTTLTKTGSAALTIGTSDANNRFATLKVAEGTLTLNNARVDTLTSLANTTVNLNNVSVNIGTLNVGGTVNISAGSRYTGISAININKGGELVLSGSDCHLITPEITIYGGGTLTSHCKWALGSSDYDNIINVDAEDESAVIRGNYYGDLNIASDIQGKGTLEFQQCHSNHGNKIYVDQAVSDKDGTLALKVTSGDIFVTSADNTYSGGTSVEGGTLTVTADSALGTGDVSVNGGALVLSGTHTLDNTIKAGDVGKVGAADASYTGVTITNTTLSGGSLTGADMDFSGAYALSNTTLTNVNITATGAASLTNSTVTLDGTNTLTLVGEAFTLTDGLLSTNVLSDMTLTGNVHLDFSSDLLAYVEQNLGEGNTLTISLGNLTISTPEATAFALGNSQITVSDALLTSFGNCTLDTTSGVSLVFDGKASDNIPEPTTATLSLLALVGLAARRRRK